VKCFDLIGTFGNWFTSPSIIPWAGAVAAFIAALTCEQERWLIRRPTRVGRALWVAAVWLLIAWGLSSMVQWGHKNGGDGQGNSGSTPTGRTPEEPSSGSSQTNPPGGSEPGTCNGWPPDVSETVRLIVRFVSLESNSAQARKFFCRLLLKGEGKSIDIQGKDMEEFRKRLAEQLRKVTLPQADKPPTVLIERDPFPGENVLRRVKDMVQETFPNATVEFVDPSKPSPE